MYQSSSQVFIFTRVLGLGFFGPIFVKRGDANVNVRDDGELDECIDNGELDLRKYEDYLDNVHLLHPIGVRDESDDEEDDVVDQVQVHGGRQLLARPDIFQTLQKGASTFKMF